MEKYYMLFFIFGLMLFISVGLLLPYRVKLWLSINFIRRFSSPLWYKWKRFTKYKGELPDVWDSIKDLPKDEFHKAIEVHSKYDYLKHERDFSPQEKNFFFLDRETSRDCTSWSRMWRWWGEHHGYKTYEIAIDDIKNWRKHALTVIKFDDGYELFDYHPTGKREKSVAKALENNLVNYEKFQWVVLKGQSWMVLRKVQTIIALKTTMSNPNIVQQIQIQLRY